MDVYVGIQVVFYSDYGLTHACQRLETNLFRSREVDRFAPMVKDIGHLLPCGLLFAAPDGTAADASLYQVFEQAQAAGAKVISLTSFLNTRGKKFTDILLRYDSVLSPMDQYAAEFALDILSSIYRVKYMADV